MIPKSPSQSAAIITKWTTTTATVLAGTRHGYNIPAHHITHGRQNEKKNIYMDEGNERPHGCQQIETSFPYLRFILPTYSSFKSYRKLSESSWGSKPDWSFHFGVNEPWNIPWNFHHQPYHRRMMGWERISKGQWRVRGGRGWGGGVSTWVLQYRLHHIKRTDVLGWLVGWLVELGWIMCGVFR